MTPSDRVPGFAPSDPTDGRDLLDWKSKYVDARAQSGILFEAIYIGALMVLVPTAMLLLWLEIPKGLLGIPDNKYATVLRYGIAWLGGTFGGTLFDAKWLYHSVARRIWHLDRRLWRVFTPHISGGLAFAVMTLISSGLLRIFDAKSVCSMSLVVGASFLVGYFSDSAIAKLSEIAETVFGTSRSKSGRIDSSEKDPSHEPNVTS